MNREHPHRPEPFWRSRDGLALLGFLAMAAFFLLTEHRAHLLGALLLVLLASVRCCIYSVMAGTEAVTAPSAMETNREAVRHRVRWTRCCS